MSYIVCEKCNGYTSIRHWIEKAKNNGVTVWCFACGGCGHEWSLVYWP